MSYRGKPRFAWLWPPDPWRDAAAAISDRAAGAATTAKTLIEQRLTASVRDRFYAALRTEIHLEILPTLAATLETSMADDTTERRIVRAMAVRDFARQWLEHPHWRARLSYQQLMQSRGWVGRVARGADALARPFAEHVCTVEVGLRTAFAARIAEEYNPTLRTIIATDAATLGRTTRLSADDAGILLTRALYARLRQTILERAVDDYTHLVRGGG